MYLEFFGLHKPPFRITPDTHAFFEGCDRGAILNALCYAVSQGEGIIKVVGEVGSGKTMLCRMLPLKLSDNIDWVYLAHPSLSPEHTLHAIAQEMGLAVADNADKLAVMRLLHETLLMRHANNRQVVVLVEEAQGMPLETLEEIRLLSNLETNDYKLMQIVLFGQPELDEKLANPSIRQLRERITHSLYLTPLNLPDIQAYLNFRLRAVGYTGPDLFSSAVARSIARYSQGLVRRINIIADKTLLSAYTQDRHTLTVDDIRQAARDSNFKPQHIFAHLRDGVRSVLGLRYFALVVMVLFSTFAGFTLTACEHVRFEPKPSTGHISLPVNTGDAAAIPAPVRAPPPLPAPQPTKKEDTHTVVVSDVPVRELLFSLARDADLNLDIDNDVEGLITLNAVNQPLPAILERVAASGGLRYSINHKVLRIRKDAPFLRNYRIDYLNMSRTSNGVVSVSTQISATGVGAGDAKAGGGGDNNSATEVKNLSENAFWASLQKNIGVIISGNRGDTAVAADGSNPDIMLNRESGIMGVRATEQQHEEIQRFVDEVQNSAQRQVLIEATIAEVKLNDRYQAGINWSLVRDGAGHNILFNIANAVNDVALNQPPAFSIGASTRLDGNLLQTTIQALQTFGDVRIMSSPKVMALNNQTALLKVVDNLVYFTVEVNVEPSSALGVPGKTTYETKVNTVPVGFVMTVTPYINEHGSVTLNVRPTISRVIRQVRDPNPELARLNVVSEIPVIQVREVESVLKISSGDVAVIGGLMQDEVNNTKRGIPGLSKIPYLGGLFRYEDDNTDKTELVIFIKPIVIKNASVAGDLREFKQFLPAATNTTSNTIAHERE